MNIQELDRHLSAKMKDLQLFRLVEYKAEQFPINAIKLYCEMNAIRHAVIERTTYAEYSKGLIEFAGPFNPELKPQVHTIISTSFDLAVARLR